MGLYLKGMTRPESCFECHLAKWIDDVIDRFDGSIAYSTNSKEICQYIADLLKELKERRKADSCEGCMHRYGEKLTCQLCARYYRDKYVAERRTDE